MYNSLVDGMPALAPVRKAVPRLLILKVQRYKHPKMMTFRFNRFFFSDAGQAERWFGGAL
jgi:hypothetical protein